MKCELQGRRCYREETPPGSGGSRGSSGAIERRPLRGPVDLGLSVLSRGDPSGGPVDLGLSGAIERRPLRGPVDLGVRRVLSRGDPSGVRWISGFVWRYR